MQFLYDDGAVFNRHFRSTTIHKNVVHFADKEMVFRASGVDHGRSFIVVVRDLTDGDAAGIRQFIIRTQEGFGVNNVRADPCGFQSTDVGTAGIHIRGIHHRNGRGVCIERTRVHVRNRECLRTQIYEICVDCLHFITYNSAEIRRGFRNGQSSNAHFKVIKYFLLACQSTI